MNRLFAILLSAFLAFGVTGLSAPSADAGPANCGSTASAVNDGGAMADLVALTETGAPARRQSLLSQGEQLACNSACARACAARFGRCPTRQCRQQFSACVRSCGC